MSYFKLYVVPAIAAAALFFSISTPGQQKDATKPEATPPVTIEGLVRDISCPIQNKEATATKFNLECAVECAKAKLPVDRSHQRRRHLHADFRHHAGQRSAPAPNAFSWQIRSGNWNRFRKRRNARHRSPEHQGNEGSAPDHQREMIWFQTDVKPYASRCRPVSHSGFFNNIWPIGSP